MKKINVREIVIFPMLGTIMFVSQLLMLSLPNVHLLGMFIVSITAVYRVKALYPIYIYILLYGAYNGFSLWWVPYLYIWAVLWGFTMLIPRKAPMWLKTILYTVACSAHGFLFGTLYAPAQALMFHLNFKGMISWIIAGLPFDCIHGVSNLIFSFLIVPLIKALELANKVGKKSDI